MDIVIVLGLIVVAIAALIGGAAWRHRRQIERYDAYTHRAYLRTAARQRPRE